MITGSATYGEGGAYNSPFRFTLKRNFNIKKRTTMLPWLMLNPSKATGQKNDPTIMRVIHFSMAWGFGSAIVLNLYPFRATDQRELWRWVNKHLLVQYTTKERPMSKMADREHIQAHEAMAENRRVIQSIDRLAGHKIRVVACGNEAFTSGPMAHARETIRDFSKCAGGQLHVLGLTSLGWPKHAMARGKHRVTDDLPWPEPWILED